MDGEVRVGVAAVGTPARAVYVQAPAAGALKGGGGGGGGQQQSAKGVGSPHPLRVLRIAGGAAAAGGGRVGRAVGGVLARGVRAPSAAPPSGDAVAGVAFPSAFPVPFARQGEGTQGGLALHLVFGPRVDRRTLEKVLRTLGSGVGEVLAVAKGAVAPVAPLAKGKPEPLKMPPSSWRGRIGEKEEGEGEEKSSGNRAGAIELLEVRSAVRAAELYKIISTVLPRYPSLCTLLLTRPPPAFPPHSRTGSPRSPSFFFPSPPSTPGFTSSSLRPPPSPSSRSPPSPTFARPPPSPSPSPPSPLGFLTSASPSAPSPSTSAPPSPARQTLAPPPPRPLLTPLISTKYDDTGEWTWEWDGWGDAADILAGADGARSHTGLSPASLRIPMDVDDETEEAFELDGSGGALSGEDATHVAAWRRHCVSLACVKMVSGAWWMREE
ncbi:hypothetical protein B0H11DRAFT_2078872 [Mycena galericulata]|nr:hypothetical protein B0H11DRAFT_2078872 [Mycena galericulata]